MTQRVTDQLLICQLSESLRRGGARLSVPCLGRTLFLWGERHGRGLRRIGGFEQEAWITGLALPQLTAMCPWGPFPSLDLIFLIHREGCKTQMSSQAWNALWLILHKCKGLLSPPFPGTRDSENFAFSLLTVMPEVVQRANIAGSYPEAKKVCYLHFLAS